MSTKHKALFLPHTSRDSHRIFVASPGDVEVERRITERVVREANSYLGTNSFLWEQINFSIGSERKIQEYIARPSDPEETFDLVVAILDERLGTPLADDFPIPVEIRDYIHTHNLKHPQDPILIEGLMGDGIPLTGTLFEIIDVLQAADRSAAAPVLHVFRARQAEMAKSKNKTYRTFENNPNEQKRAVDRVFESLLNNHNCRSYSTPEAFEGELKSILEVKFSNHFRSGKTSIIRDGPDYLERICRGLGSYGPKDGAVFFGRDRQIAATLERLSAAHRKSTIEAPFLLVSGSSGSGKSSFLRAGIAHQLLRVGAHHPRELGVRFHLLEIIPEDDGAPNFSSFVSSLWAAFGIDSPLPAEVGDCNWEDADAALTMFLDHLNRANPANSNIPLVIFDQFEEALGDGRDNWTGPASKAIWILAELAHRRLIWSIASITDSQAQTTKSHKTIWQERVAPRLSHAEIQIIEVHVDPISDADSVSGILSSIGKRAGFDVMPDAEEEFGQNFAAYSRKYGSARGCMPLLSLLIEQTITNFVERQNDKSARYVQPALSVSDLARSQNLIERLGELAFKAIEEELGTLYRAISAIDGLIKRFVTAIDVGVSECQYEFDLKTASLSRTNATDDQKRAAEILKSHKLMQTAGVQSLRFTHRSILEDWPRLAERLQHHTQDIIEHARFIRHDIHAQVPETETLLKWSRLYNQIGFEGSVLKTEKFRSRNKWLAQQMLSDALEESDPEVYSVYLNAAIEARDTKLSLGLLKNAVNDNPRNRHPGHRRKDPSDPIQIFRGVDQLGEPFGLKAINGELFAVVDMYCKHSQNLLRADRRGNTLLHGIIRKNSRKHLKPVLQQVARMNRSRTNEANVLDATDGAGLTPLMMAARNANQGLIQELISRGASVSAKVADDHKRYAGWQAVHFAAATNAKGKRHCLALLHKSGADLRARAANGGLPLHAAAFWGHAGTLKWLLGKTKTHWEPDLAQRVQTPANETGDTPLISATRSLDLEAVEAITGLKRLEIPDLGEAIRIAAGEGYKSILAHLLAIEHKSNFDLDTKGRNALHVAAQWGRADCLELLLSRDEWRSKIDDTDDDDWTALHYACQFGRERSAQLLLQHGARVGLRNNKSMLPIQLAAFQDSPAIQNLLLEFGGDAVYGEKVFDTLIAMRDEESILNRFDLEFRAWAMTECKASGSHPLHKIARHGLMRIYRLVAPRYFDLSVASWSDLLKQAVFGGHPHVISQIMKSWDPAQRSAVCSEFSGSHSRTVLHDVAEYGTLDAAREILPWSNPNVFKPDGAHQTPAHIAAFHGRTDLLKLFHTARGEALFEPTPKYGTICSSAATGEATHTIEWCKKTGANLDIGDRMGLSPLHNAAKKGKLAGIQRLLKCGANPNQKDIFGYQPIHLALAHDQVGAFEILNEYGEASQKSDAEIEQEVDALLRESEIVRDQRDKERRKDQDTAILEAKELKVQFHKWYKASAAIGERNKAQLKASLQSRVDPHTDRFGPPLVVQALEKNQFDLVEITLEHTPNALTRNDWSYGAHLLHLAVINDNPRSVEFCLKKGSRIDGLDSLGRTPLGISCQMLSVDSTKALLSNGNKGSVQVIDKFGRTPLHLLARVDTNGVEGRTSAKAELVRLLLDHGYGWDDLDNEGISARDVAVTVDDLPDAVMELSNSSQALKRRTKRRFLRMLQITGQIALALLAAGLIIAAVTIRW